MILYLLCQLMTEQPLNGVALTFQATQLFSTGKRVVFVKLVVDVDLLGVELRVITRYIGLSHYWPVVLLE